MEAMEDEMVRYLYQFNGHDFEKTLGDSGGQRSLVCCSLWGCKELDMTQELNNKETTQSGLQIQWNPHQNPPQNIFFCRNGKSNLYIHTKMQEALISQNNLEKQQSQRKYAFDFKTYYKAANYWLKQYTETMNLDPYNS